jgi:hypothetical protein
VRAAAPRRRTAAGLVVPVAVMVALASGLAVVVRRDRMEAERSLEAEAAGVATRRAVFARGFLDETLSMCRAGWREELDLHHEPVALAWTRTGVDGFFLEGTDGGSLRQVRCDARGVRRGPRFVHPLHGLLPAESPGPPAGQEDDAAWHRAVGDAPRTFADGEVAFEILRHPVTGQTFARRWREGAAGAFATVEPTDAPAFPLLVPAAAFTPAPGQAARVLEPLARRYWLSRPEAAFALLARELPDGAVVSELTIDEDRIEARVAHPTKAFAGRPSAPFGDREWDEYGIASLASWYPRETAGFGCPDGRPLAAVRFAFAEATSRRGGAALARAWYSCSPAYSNGRDGVWRLLPD